VLSGAYTESTLLVEGHGNSDLYRRRFQRGHFCVLAQVGHKGAGFVWGQLGGPHIEERYGFEIGVRPDEVFYYDLYIRPEYRGLGVVEELIYALSVHSREIGALALVAIVELQNRRSIAVHKRLGMKCGRTHYFVSTNKIAVN